MRQAIREKLEQNKAKLEQPMAAETQETTFTQAQFMEMMKLLIESNKSATLEAIAKFKEPDEYTKEKQDKERAIQKQARIDRMNSAIAEERQKRNIHFLCSHLKRAEGVMRESHAFTGQVNSDGYFRPVCCRCFRVMPRVKASDEHIRNGVALRDIPGVSARIILSWHRKTDPDCKECAKGLCAVRQLREIEQGHLDPEPEVLPDGKIKAEDAVRQMSA